MLRSINRENLQEFLTSISNASLIYTRQNAGSLKYVTESKGEKMIRIRSPTQKTIKYTNTWRLKLTFQSLFNWRKNG